MYPFLEKIGNKFYVKVNKELYSKELIDRAKMESVGSVLSISTKKKCYLVELDTDDIHDYFNFINFLIYLSRK